MQINELHRSRQDICVNCNWSITLCDKCSQSILPCGLDEVSIKSWKWPVKVFYAFTEGYINQEHTRLVCVLFENLVSG